MFVKMRDSIFNLRAFYPDLLFLVFFGKWQGKPPKNKDLLSLPNPWERKEKRAKKQGIP